MGRIKSLFISIYMMLMMFIFTYSIWQLWQGHDEVRWAGLMLTVMPMIGTLIWLLISKSMARTSLHLPLVQGLALLGLAMVWWSYDSDPSAMSAAGLAISAELSLLLYIYWYSSLKKSGHTGLNIDQMLPELELLGSHGIVQFNRTLGEQAVIMLFFRGNWCPLCMAQIRELAGQYQQLNTLGVRVALISPQPHQNTEQLARQFAVHFEFYTDPGNQAAIKLGLEHQNGLPMGMQMLGYDSDTVLPTAIILNRQGRVIWYHQTDNYRIRPEPETFLAVLRQNELTE